MKLLLQVCIDIFNSFNARTERLNIFANILKNKCFMFIILFITIIQILLIYFGGNMFRTVGLNIKELELMIFLASTVIPIDLIRKIIVKQKRV